MTEIATAAVNSIFYDVLWLVMIVIIVPLAVAFLVLQEVLRSHGSPRLKQYARALNPIVVRLLFMFGVVIILRLIYVVL